MGTPDGGYWTEKLRKEVETEERNRLAGLQSLLSSENYDILTEFALQLFPAITALFDQINTAEASNQAGEYLLAAKSLLASHRPILLDSACEIQADKVTFRSWPGYPATDCFLQQVFYQATKVIKAQELLADMKTAFQGLAARDIVRYTEEALAELPNSPKLCVLFASTDATSEPCNLLSRTIYDLLTYAIAALCERNAYSEAVPFRIKANQLFSQRKACESPWRLSIPTDLILPAAQNLYKYALNTQTVDSYCRALDCWYLLEPLGSTSFDLLVRLGDLHFSHKDDTSAILAYRKAELIIRHDKQPAERTVLTILRLCKLQGKHCYAPIIRVNTLQYALHICSFYPENPSLLLDTLYSLAKAYTDAMKLTDAEITFVQCLSLMNTPPCHPLAGVYYHFAKQQMKSEHFSEAESLLSQALSSFPHPVEEFSKHDVYLSLLELYTRWKPEEVERTLLCALNATLGGRNEGDWTDKVIEYYRSRARDREEAVAVMALKGRGRAMYRRYQSLRYTRDLYR
jgi:tetratricopeptide (TPR) repeat protein